jgi:hypothetical protein
LEILINNIITPTSSLPQGKNPFAVQIIIIMCTIREKVTGGCIGRISFNAVTRRISDSTGNRASLVPPVLKSLYWLIRTEFF